MARHFKNKKEEKPIDTVRVVRHLKHMFETATDGLQKAGRDDKGRKNQKYLLEEDLAYLIDEITRGPRFSALRAINDANALIEGIQVRK